MIYDFRVSCQWADGNETSKIELTAPLIFLHKVLVLLLGLHTGVGPDLLRNVLVEECRVGDELLGRHHAFGHSLEIILAVRCLVLVLVDFERVLRVRAGEFDPATRSGVSLQDNV